MDIETNGAHSLRTRPLSRDWKALIRNESTSVRMFADWEVSRLIDKTRRNSEAKRPESSAKTSSECQILISHFGDGVLTPGRQILPALDGHDKGNQEHVVIR